MTRSSWTAARTKDSNTKKFVATNHAPSTFSIKVWILTPVWFGFGGGGGGTSLLSSQSAGFLNKVSIPCPNNLSLNLSACGAASCMSVGLVTALWHTIQQPIVCPFLFGISCWSVVPCMKYYLEYISDQRCNHSVEFKYWGPKSEVIESPDRKE